MVESETQGPQCLLGETQEVRHVSISFDSDGITRSKTFNFFEHITISNIRCYAFKKIE